MRLWLVTIGEPLPIKEGASDRLYRTGLLAQLAANNGISVTWWTSAFDHFRKKHWVDADTVVQLTDNLELRLLYGSGYQKNLSLARIKDHRQLARSFSQAIQNAPPPDIILCSLPTLELCWESIKYGEKHKIPVVLDMRDMWPDIWLSPFPRVFHPFLRLLLLPLYRQAHRVCAGATAIIGITDAFVEWGLNRGQRQRTALDKAFPMGYVSIPPKLDAIKDAERFWDELGVYQQGKETRVCFFGALGRQFDFLPVIDAAEALHQNGIPWTFVICGLGDKLEQYRKRTNGLPNLLFPGWVDAAKIHVLMRRSAVGLDPMPDRFDFRATINNKAIEYLSAGLPVISSPQRGILHDLLRNRNCGFSYAMGDKNGLVGILSTLFYYPKGLSTMAANAQLLFDEEFEAATVYRALTDHLKCILQQKNSHPKIQYLSTRAKVSPPGPNHEH